MANRRARRRARRRTRRASADCVDLHFPFKLLVVGRWRGIIHDGPFMSTGQDCMLHDGHTSLDLVTSQQGHGHNCKLESRVHVTAATRDSDVLDSPAADLPLAT